MTTRAGRPFLYIHVSGLREIILPLSGGGGQQIILDIELTLKRDAIK